MGKKKQQQIYQFKLKFDTWTNLNMKNSIVMLFFMFMPEVSFFGNFFPKNQLLKLKFRTYTNLNMESCMVIFFVSFLSFFFRLDEVNDHKDDNDVHHDDNNLIKY